MPRVLPAVARVPLEKKKALDGWMNGWIDVILFSKGTHTDTPVGWLENGKWKNGKMEKWKNGKMENAGVVKCTLCAVHESLFARTSAECSG